MQNTIGNTSASAPLALASSIYRPAISKQDLTNSIEQGQGARELESLAKRYGHARARRLYALSGHEIDGRDLVEVYHAQFAIAATRTGSLVPDFQAQEWREALDNAQREADACHYAHGRDSRRTVSRDIADETEATRDDRVALREWQARTCRAGSLRRLVRHARECLVVHWSLASGRANQRTWREALRDDLRKVATLARVARGAGFGTFGDYAEFNGSAARKAFQRLALRIASGDLLLTDQPEAGERAITDWKDGKREKITAAAYRLSDGSTVVT